MKINTIRFQITVLYSLIVALVLLVYSLQLYYGLVSMLFRDIDARLLNKAQKIEKSISTYGHILEADSGKLLSLFDHIINPEEEDNAGFSDQKAARLNEFDNLWEELRNKLDLDEDYVAILYPVDKVAAVSDNMDEGILAFVEKVSKELPDDSVAYRDLVDQKQHFRLISFPAVYRESSRYRICVISSTQDVVVFLRKRALFMVMTAPVILLLTCFFGVLLVARALKPIVGIARTAEDISQENLSQRVKTDLRDKEVTVLTDAFNDMLSRLQKSFRRIEEFSSNAAHELKTPLAIIRCETEYALKREQDSAEYKRILSVCQGESRRMLKTIDDLLLLTKLDHLVGEWQTVDLGQLLNNVVEQVRPLSDRKGVALKADLEQERLYVRAVPDHLRRVFVNLLDNAVKFTPKGGEILLKACARKDRAEVQVVDTGIGIPAKNLSRLFDRFFHTEDTEGASGSGLGLGIARHIVEAHHGTISVASEPGKGSTFTVSLPLAA